MRCSTCNKNSTLCGCSDAPLTTNTEVTCEPNAQCPEPLPCSEYISAACVYLNDGIYDADLPPQTSLEEALQQITLMITNPECTNTDSCNCPGGGGIVYNGDQGVYKDTSVTPETFVLGAPTGEESTIPFQENRFIDTDDYYLQLKGNGGVIVAREGNEALPPKLSTINATADQNSYAGYFSATSFPAIYAKTSGNGQTALEVINDGTGATSTSATFACDEGKGILGISKFTNTLDLNIDGSSPTSIDEVLLVGKNTTTLVTPAVGQGTSIGMGPGRDVFGYLIPRGTVLNSVMSSIGEDGRVPVQAVVDFRVDTYNYGSVEPHMTCVGYGLLKLHKYGIGTFADTPAYLLGVTATGDVIETTPLEITGNNGLTADTPSSLKLGGTLLEDTTIDNGSYTLDITGTNAVPNNWGVLRVENTNTANNSVALYAESVATGTNVATAYFKSTGTVNANLLVETTGANSISSITAKHSATSSSNSHAAIIANATNINGPTALVAQTANTGTLPAFRAIKDYASYSGVQNVVSITTKGNGSNGGGSALYYEHVGSTGSTSIETNRLESVWKDSTVASYATTFRLTGTDAAGTGQNTLIEIDSDVAAGTLFRIMNALPTSPVGLAAGSLYTQTATEIGGSGATKVICIV